MRVSGRSLGVGIGLLVGINRVHADEAHCSISTDALKKATSEEVARAGAPAKPARAAVPATAKVEITQASRLSVALTNPPSTRLRLSFDGKLGGHAELDWDPTVSAELGRVLTLSKDTWMVSASVEPLTYTQSAGAVVIQTTFDSVPVTKQSAASLQGVYTAIVAALANRQDPDQMRLDQWPGPTLTFTCETALLNMEDARFAPAAETSAASGLRGFGVAPAAVTDTLAILAEIAVERAKAGALALLKQRLVDPFCTAPSKVTLAKLHLGFSDELALPRTCEMLSSMRLDDILSSGRPLLVALRDDLRRTIAPAAITELAPNDGILQTGLQATLSVANAAVDRGGINALDSQLAIELLGSPEKLGLTIAAPVLADFRADLVQQVAALAAEGRSEIVTKLKSSCRTVDATCIASAVSDALEKPFTLSSAQPDKPDKQDHLKELIGAFLDKHETLSKFVGDACQARLVVAAIKHCQHDSCSAQDLTDLIRAPASHFEPDKTLPLALCWTGDGKQYRLPGGEAAEVARLVSDGLTLVAPVVDGKGRDRARALVRLLADVMKRWRPDPQVKGYIDSFTELAEALIDQDYGTALNTFLALASKVQPGNVPAPARKVIQLLGAVASYAAVYGQTKDADPKAAREARKQALEGLIDQATDRHGRDEDTIVSLGSNVGLSAAWTGGLRSGWGDVEPGVRVPLGVTVDLKPVGPVAFHVGVLFVDLGQFVHRDDMDELKPVHWDDFVSPGLEVGFALPRLLDRKLNVSLHAAFAPSLPQSDPSKSGVWRYGISIGYYVPFFDFN